MYEPAVIDPVEDPRWSAFVSDSAEATAFHHPAWLRLLHGAYGYRMLACCLTDSAGRVVAGLPVAEVRSRLTGDRLVALPFTDRCEPLADAGSAGELANAIEAWRGERGLPLVTHGSGPALPPGDRSSGHVTHRLDLDGGVAEVEKRFRKSQVRRGIAKARRAGVTVERRTDVEALDDFYRLHLITRRRQGVPTQPRSFIRAFAKLFGEGLGYVLLARSSGRVIAAAVFLEHGGTVIYKYGASDPHHLDQRPNNLIFAEAIRHSCEAGAAVLDFGRTDLGNDGLRAFKRSWGAEETELAYTYIGRAAEDVGGGSAARVVERLVRFGPPITGRAIGAVLYRHAA